MPAKTTFFAAFAAALALTSGVAAMDGKADLHAQCGGKGYNGPTECAVDAVCTFQNDYFSICTDAGNEGRRPYENCGGKGYTGPTNCLFGYTCVEQNPYYSQCLKV